MDAHWLVTPEEGDRYPLGPPSLTRDRVTVIQESHKLQMGVRFPLPQPGLFRSSTAVVQLTVNQLVVGSIPASGANFALLV